VRPVLVALLLLCMATPSRADEPNPTAKVLDEMHAAYKGVSALRAGFVQTSTGMSFFEPMRQTGTITLEAPGRMRWEFSTPRKQQYLSDGVTLWVVDEADRTCTVFRSIDGMLQSFYGFLTGTADLRKDFRVELVTEESPPVSNAAVLKLTPLQPDGSIDSLRVYVHTTSHRVVGISMLTPFGDRTDTVLSDVAVMEDVPDADFSWAARDGFRVINGD
jgi:outer membrane lipoprotein carrier protein